MFTFPRVSPQRAREIVREIAKSSRMRGRFFVLLIAASMIASFGLIANSTAVIIGAMLVSPLMTPIFGVALGMLRGNPRLLLRALTSETLGVILAVASAYLVGFMGLAHWTMGDATPEMLARTQPNLLDLLVAIFAGFAGAYALIDETSQPGPTRRCDCHGNRATAIDLRVVPRTRRMVGGGRRDAAVSR